MLPTPLVRPFSALRRWLRFSWLGRLPFPGTTRHAPPPRKPAARQPQVEGYEDRSSFSDTSVLGAAMPLAGVGLLAAPLLTPSAILRDGWSAPAPKDPLTSTLGASPAPPAVQDLVFASWSSRGDSLDQAIEAATGRQPAGEPEFVLPPGATELVLADKGPDDTGWLDDLDGVLSDKGGKAGGTGFAGLPGLPDSGWDAGGVSGGYERGGRGPLWDGSGRGPEQTGNDNDNPYSYPGLFDSLGTTSRSSTGGLTTPSVAETWGESGQAAVAVAPPPPTLRPDFGTLPVAFEANLGQSGSSAQFLARGSGYQVGLTPTAMSVAVRRPRFESQEAVRAGDTPQDNADLVRIGLVGANPQATLEARRDLLSRGNYFRGGDSPLALSDVPHYGEILARDVYDGIDVLYQGDGRLLRFDFLVAPGADPGAVELSYDGARSVRLDEQGRVLLELPGGELEQRAPVAYQEDASGRRESVRARFVDRGEGRFGLEVGGYDASRALVIDPTLSFTALAGGDGDDLARGVAADAAGNVYVVGATGAAGFPTTPGAYNDSGAIFTSKYTATGSLVYSAILGGGSGGYYLGDSAYAVAVDAGGYAYLTGAATDSGFPTTDGAFRETGAGLSGLDSFAVKISPAGNQLVYASYLPGNDIDIGRAIAVDAAGYAYVAGETSSSDFPTASALSNSLQGGSDGFLVKISPDGGSAVFSTYVGAGGADAVHGLALDGLNRIYLGGTTSSSTGLATGGAYDTTLSGATDGFLMRVAADGLSKEYASYYGGTGDDGVNAVAIDSQGRVVLAGGTSSTDLATTGAYQSTHGGSIDAWVARLGAGSTTPGMLSYYGGWSSEEAFAVAVDGNGDIHLGGRTNSSNFPVLNASQGSYGGGYYDGFLVKLDGSSPSTRLYATFLGGNDIDEVYGVAADSDGNTYAVGQTFSTDFPGGGGAGSDYSDAFLTRLDRLGPPAFTGIGSDSGTAGDAITTDTTLTLSGTAVASATVSVYRAGLGLLGTTTADGSGNWTYDYTATTLAEGSYAFTATQTSGGLTSRPSDPFAVVVDVTTPTVALEVEATTYDQTPEVLVTAWDLQGLPDGTAVTLDVDLNNDNDFSDTGESGYASGTLANGAALFAVTPALAVGTVKMRVRVSDLAGNESTSATHTVVVGTSPTNWPATDVTRQVDALSGDGLLQVGNLNLTHALDLDLSPGTWVGGGHYLSYNSERVDVRPIVAMEIQTDSAIALPDWIVAQLTWDGTALSTQEFSTAGLSPGDVITVAQRVDAAVTTTGRYTYQLDVTMDYGTPITRFVTGHVFVVAEDASALGAGWTLGGVDRLVEIEEDEDNDLPAGMLRVYGGKHASFYEDNGTGYTSPTGDNGTLTTITGGFRYESPDGWRREFDSSGYQTSLASPDGTWRTTYTWGSGRLDRIDASDGSRTTLTYDGSFKLETIKTGPRTVTLTVNGSGDLTQITNPDGGQHNLTYSGHRPTGDTFGLLSTGYSYTDGALTGFTPSGGGAHTVAPASLKGLASIHAGTVRSVFSDGAGRVQTWDHDLWGRAERVIAGDGGVTRWTRDGNGWVTGITDALGRVTTLTLDGAGYVTQETFPDGNTRAYQYDPTYHGVTKVTDERGKATTVTYSGSLPSTTINAENKTTTQVWSSGLLESVTDALGRVTTYLYDAARRLQATVDAAGGRVTLTYDNHGNVETRKDELGRVTTYVNDALGRVLNTISPLGARTTALYDGAGLLLSFRDALNVLTTYLYDARGLQKSVIEASGTSVQRSTLSSYDGAGQRTASRDANGNWGSTTYDGAGRATRFENALGGVSRSFYDLAGQYTGGTDELNQGGSSVYNSRGWATRHTDALGNVTTSVFDQAGNLTGTINALGVITSHVYDNVGRRVSTTEAVGTADERTSTVVYDNVGNVYQEIDWLGRTTEYEYDALYRMTKVTQAKGTSEERSATYAYDAVGNQTGSTDFRGYRTESTFDAENRRTVFKEAVGTSEQRTSTTVYDAGGRVDGIVDALGRVTSFVYDSLHRQIATKEAVGTSLARTTTSMLDAVNRGTGSVNALGKATATSYDALGRMIAGADELGRTTRTSHDAAGNATSWEDANGNRGTAVYDKLNRSVRGLDGLGNVTSTVYDALGRVEATVDARGNRTTFSYDGLNRQVTVKDGLNRVSTTVYDKAGNVLRTIDATGATITMTYDSLNRMVTRQQPGDGVQTTVYDAGDNVVNEVNGLGHKQTLVYDALGRKTKHVDALGGVTTFLYDLLNNNTGLIDPVGNRTTFVFDALNRVTDETDPLNKTATVAYDAVGRVSSQTDRLGRRREYTYDDSGRLTSETWKESGGSTANVLTHTYDDNGNLLSAQDNDGTYTMVYDALNRVSSVQGLFGMRLTFTYDASGNRTKVEDSLGGVTTSVYNAVNALTRREFGGSGQTPLRFDLAYTDRHQVSGLTRYSDLAGSTKIGETSYTYDAAGRSQNINHKNGSGTSLINLTYTYDLASRVTSETRNGTPTSYAYDHTDQLASDGVNSYTYDANGNRTMSGYQTGAGNRMTNDGVYTYTYDDQGNTTKKSKGASLETWDYSYDHRNQLVGVEKRATDGGTLQMRATYVYDVFGNRIQRQAWDGSTTTTTRFAVTGWDREYSSTFDVDQAFGFQSNRVLAELDGSNALVTRYLHGQLDEVVARLDNGGTANWLLADRQTTIIGVTNASGSVIDTITYDGFGVTLTESNSAHTGNYGYTGVFFDRNAGLMLTFHRAYAYATGKFYSYDPITFRAGDANLLRYVGNNSTNAVDPSGMEIKINGQSVTENDMKEVAAFVNQVAAASKTPKAVLKHTKTILDAILATDVNYRSRGQLVSDIFFRYFAVKYAEKLNEIGPKFNEETLAEFPGSLIWEKEEKIEGVRINRLTQEAEKGAWPGIVSRPNKPLGETHADAIREFFDPKKGRRARLECASAQVVVYRMAWLAVVGDEAYNKNCSTTLIGFYDPHDPVGKADFKRKPIPGDGKIFLNPDAALSVWERENTLLLFDNTFYGHGIGIKSEKEMVQKLNDQRIPAKIGKIRRTAAPSPEVSYIDVRRFPLKAYSDIMAESIRELEK